MAISELNLLGFMRIREIFDAVVDQRQIPGGFVFSNRITKNPATDADIIGRFLGQAHIADIVADDQRAVTYEAARIKFETNLIPNIKLGRTLTQEDIKRLEYLARNTRPDGDSNSFEAYFQREGEALLTGINMREESMIIGMYIDQFTYSRNGIILSINWGMPAEMKFTAVFPWTDATNGTPVSDLLNLRLTIATKYGKTFSRVTMSTPAFRNMIRTAEFQAQVRNFIINLGQPLPNIPFQSLDYLKNLAGSVLGMTIELYDRRYPSHPVDGSAIIYTPYLPLNKVILSDIADDGDTNKADFAMGIVTESVVGSMGSNNAFGRFAPTQGPFSYVTVPGDLNPPTATFWAVERGMPRKFDLALSAVVDCGPVTDFITPGIVF